MGPKRFWMVFNSSGRPPKKRHPSYNSAYAEAERIAASRPGVKCYVLEAKAYLTTGQPQEGGAYGPVTASDL